MQITGGFLKSRKIDSPKGTNVRPTLSQIRESIFSVLAGLTSFEESDFLDVFSGSGIMAFEAISRGFQQAVLIEKDKKTYFLLKENAKKLGITPEILIGNSLKVLKKINKTFDVIYIDPPYSDGLYSEIFKIIDEYNLLDKNGIIAVEHPKDMELDTDNFILLKQKLYADKAISFFQYHFGAVQKNMIDIE
jgi:16S rRNA (guanine(966)-N(2))-methyltransferase RsmD